MTLSIEPIEAWAVTSDGGMVPMGAPIDFTVKAGFPAPVMVQYRFEIVTSESFTCLGLLVLYNTGRIAATRGTEASLLMGDTLTYTLTTSLDPV